MKFNRILNVCDEMCMTIWWTFQLIFKYQKSLFQFFDTYNLHLYHLYEIYKNTRDMKNI